MDVEQPRYEEHISQNSRGDGGGERDREKSMINGISNGYGKEHKSEHKDKHRDKDRHKHSSSKSSHRDKEKDRDRKHKDEKKSSSSSNEKEKDRHKSSSGSSNREHKSSSSSSKEKDRHTSSSGSSSKDKDRHSSQKDKHNSSAVKDKEKHSSSSSSSKEKHHSSSSSSKDKDRDKHSSSSSRDKEREKDRHKEKSKESKDKERSKSSHSDHHKSKEHRDKDREREKEKRREKEEGRKKEKEERQEEEEEVIAPIIMEPVKVEPETETDNEGTMNDSAPEESLQIDEDNDEVDIKPQIKEESEDETPLAFRTAKRELSDDEDEDDTPLFERLKKTKHEDDSEDEKPKKSKAKKRKSRASDTEEEESYKPAKKKPTKGVKREGRNESISPRKGGKKEDDQEVWRWWEEDKKDDGTKWTFLEHKGPLFAPAYEPLPKNVKFYYDGKEMELSEDTEEVATFYAKMLDHDYTSKSVFNSNFFSDWRKVMTDKEKKLITELKKCNFKDMALYFKEKTEERKGMSKEEKKKIKEQNDEIQKIYGFCTIDGHKEKIGNFRIEPPGLFRGRGEHPKMGKLKKRVWPEDVIINCSRDSDIPAAPKGHKWKKVQSDQTVTWLASWTENVQGNVKYVMLNPSSKLKGEKDMLKYETARKLAKKIHRIREQYQSDWKSKEMRIRQRAVALYFIDRLALRAGNEKDEDQADTVGCCSLRVEHVQLHEELNGKEHVVVFDFLGKDSIRYYNEVPVEKRVFKNLLLFMENKQGQDDLFDRLNTAVLNKHLNELMEGLTAKVFRTYNASWTLQEQLNNLTNPDDSVAEKILSYNRANRAVAILCNHQRSVPKSHEKSMENLKGKIEQKKEQIDEVKQEMKDAKRKSNTSLHEKKKKQLERLKEQLMKLEVQETDREENKTIALGTSKLNYLDPRISVAWCKKFDVPIEKVYNKTQRDKFRWAIDMAGPDYVF